MWKSTSKYSFILKFKQNLYLIVPMCCLLLWALYFLINSSFLPRYQDFRMLYLAGRQVFINPAELYKIKAYYYTPNFAVVFAVSISLLPFSIAYYVFYAINCISGVLYIKESNHILRMMVLKLIFINLLQNNLLLNQYLLSQLLIVRSYPVGPFPAVHTFLYFFLFYKLFL